jgi:adenine-specific DNA-methyltransferase
MPTLDWIGKSAVVNHHREVPTRLLHCDGALSAGDADAGNLLVEGDNLEALKALLPYYGGQVKCIYIDPPYNTGNEGWVYNDNVNSPEIRAWLGKVVGREAEDLSRHDKWLCMMYPRLRLLRDFLAPDGSLWVSIDDDEGHYLKAMLDEVFGRRNFISNVIWQKKYAPANDALWLSDSHDHIMVYALNKAAWRPQKLARTEATDAAYKNPDDDPRGPWKPGDYTCAKSADERPNLFYGIVNPTTGEEVWPSRTRVWGYSKDLCETHQADNLLWWGKTGKNRVPSLKRLLTSLKTDGTNAQTIWSWEDVGHTQDGRKEQLALFPNEPFPTPKPERLIKRIVEIATLPGDLVLDSFAGSGTTAAVSHKLDRRHISVEMGDHARTHCAPRLIKVIEGEDGGISQAVGWQGGSGFRYCTLGKPLFDEWGTISEGVSFSDLAAFVFFSDTGSPIPAKATGDSSLLGTFQHRAVHLLWSAESAGVANAVAGNVLTAETLAALPMPSPDFDGAAIVYGEGCTVTAERLAAAGVTFKQIPYQVIGA